MQHKSIISLLVALFLIPSLAFAGPSGGGAGDIGGGNSYEIEFKNIGQNLAGQMLSLGLTQAQLGFSQSTFQDAVKTTLVFSTPDPVNLNDEIRQAINSKTNHVIVFNETMWGLLSNTQKSMLALHEYLRFVNVDDSSYQISTRVDQLLSLQNGGVLPTPMPTKIRVIGVTELATSESGVCNGACTYAQINLQYGSSTWSYYASCESETYLHIFKVNDSVTNGPVQSIYHNYGSDREQCRQDLRYLSNGSELFPVFVSFDREAGILIY